MAARELDPGTHGEVSFTPQCRDEAGRWKTCQSKHRTHERWRAGCYYRDLEGERGRIDKTGTTREKALTKVEAEWKIKRNGRSSENGYMKDTTLFVDAGRAWLTEINRSDSGLAPRSVADYTRKFRGHIENPRPELLAILKRNQALIRDMRLAEANDTQRLRKYLQAVADVHGTDSAKVTRSVVANILNLAVENGVLPVSALRNVKPVTSQKPRESTRDTERAFTREQRDHLISYADRMAGEFPVYDDRSRRKWRAAADLLAFMAASAARVSEARGLRWEDVDWEKKQILLHGKGSKDRMVDMLPEMEARLRRRYDESECVGYVFASPTFTDPEFEWDQSNCAKALSVFIEGAGFTWATPHTLRRTWITLAHEAGVPLHVIADQVGHANTVMTGKEYLGRNWMGSRAEWAKLAA